jgi:hypothetical protein
MRFKFYAHMSIGPTEDVGDTGKELQPALSKPEQMTWDQVSQALHFSHNKPAAMYYSASLLY